MNALAEAIKSLELTGKPAEIRESLNADVDLPHVHDLWTYNGVAQQFGPQVAEGLAQAMTAAGLTTAVMVYASRGFDLSLELTRQQLDLIAENVKELAEVCTALKLIGRPTQKRFAAAALESLPSEAEIETALAQIAFADWAELTIQTLQAAINGEQTDIAAYKQMIAGA